MSTRTKKAIKRPANKQSRGTRRGSQKTVNVVQEKKQTGKHAAPRREAFGAKKPPPPYPQRRPPSGSLRELSLKHAASLSAMPLCRHTPARRVTRNLLRKETA